MRLIHYSLHTIKVVYTKIKRMIINQFFGTQLPWLGNIIIKLNLLDDRERDGIFSNNFDFGEIQALKNLLDEKSYVILFKPESSIIPVFIGKNIGCSIALVSSSARIKKDLVRNNIEKVTFLNSLFDIESNSFSYKILIIHEKYLNATMQLPKTDAVLLILKEYENQLNVQLEFTYNYKWIAGRALLYNQDVKSKFFLFSNKRFGMINIHKNNYEKKISGFSLIRNADIYPFDLCYESILEIVDEFILGIDKNIPDNHGDGENSRQRLIERFLDNTNYRNKIKIIDDYDFGVRFCEKINPRARWIADVNNLLLSNCSFGNCIYIMADEMYHEDSYEEILHFANQTKYTAMWHYFLHFVTDLVHIRRPRTVAYTNAIRVLKKDKYTSFHDGYSFSSIYERPPYHTVTKKPLETIDAKYPIYHLGYVMDFRKKIKIHAEKEGIFANRDFLYLLNDEISDLIEYKGPYPKFLFNQEMDSYQKIKHLLLEKNY